MVALLLGSADASAQGVVAVAHSGVAALNFGELVVGAPVVVGGVLGRLRNHGQACSEQRKAYFLGNACNGGWQDGAEHFNQRGKFEGG